MKQVIRYPLVAIVLVLSLMVLLAGCQTAPIVKADSFDYAAAADNQAARWIAMGEFYASRGMLNDSFDYEQAVDNQAARWIAMAEYYANNDMLNEPFDYAAAADNLAARWLAMADYYAKHDMLNNAVPVVKVTE